MAEPTMTVDQVRRVKRYLARGIRVAVDVNAYTAHMSHIRLDQYCGSVLMPRTRTHASATRFSSSKMGTTTRRRSGSSGPHGAGGESLRNFYAPIGTSTFCLENCVHAELSAFHGLARRSKHHARALDADLQWDVQIVRDTRPDHDEDTPVSENVKTKLGDVYRPTEL